MYFVFTCSKLIIATVSLAYKRVSFYLKKTNLITFTTFIVSNYNHYNYKFTVLLTNLERRRITDGN